MTMAMANLWPTIGLLRSLNEIREIGRKNSVDLPSPVVEGGPLDFDYCITTCRLHMCDNSMGSSHFYVRKAAGKESGSSTPWPEVRHSPAELAGSWSKSIKTGCRNSNFSKMWMSRFKVMHK